MRFYDFLFQKKMEAIIIESNQINRNQAEIKKEES